MSDKEYQKLLFAAFSLTGNPYIIEELLNEERLEKVEQEKEKNSKDAGKGK